VEPYQELGGPHFFQGVSSDGVTMGLNEIGESVMASLYAHTQMILEHFMPEATAYYLTLVCLVIALLIESVLIYLTIRYFWRKSMWGIWFSSVRSFHLK
jgi:hypothetical protein